MSDTPMTDALVFRAVNCLTDERTNFVAADFARTLERELARWQNAAEQATAEREHNANVAGELRAKLVEQFARTCIHHNDAERANAYKSCPVCAINRAERVERERDAADQRIRELEAVLAAAQTARDATCIKLAGELREARADNAALRSSHAAIYTALGTNEADHTKWPAQIAALRAALEEVLSSYLLVQKCELNHPCPENMVLCRKARAALGKGAP